jgi:hypothetical protein
VVEFQAELFSPPKNHHTGSRSEFSEALLFLGWTLTFRGATTASTGGHSWHSRHATHPWHPAHSWHSRHATHPWHSWHVSAAHLLHEAPHLLEISQNLVHICGLVATPGSNTTTPARLRGQQLRLTSLALCH